MKSVLYALGSLILAMIFLVPQAQAQVMFWPDGWMYWPGHTYWPGYTNVWGEAVLQALDATHPRFYLAEIGTTYQEVRPRVDDNAYNREYYELWRMTGSHHASKHHAQARQPIERHQPIPQRLTGEQLDESSGRIHWPAILMANQFAEARGTLERLFAQRSVDPDTLRLGAPNYVEVRERIAAMETGLKASIDEINPADFVAGHKFLRSLAYEAQLAPRSHVRLHG